MLEGLWTFRFRRGEDRGAGVIVFETGRLFGGDSSFYFLGTYTVENGFLSGEVEVTRHAELSQFIFPRFDSGTIKLSGPMTEPHMTLTGHLAPDTRQHIAVICTRRTDLPNP